MKRTKLEADPMLMARDDQAEAGVIGAIMLADEILDDVSPLLKPEHFVRDDCQTIYREMLSMRANGKRIDVTLLNDRLKKSGKLEQVGGLHGISQFAIEVHTPQFGRHYAEIVRRNALKRQAYSAAYQIAEQASDESLETEELHESLDKLVYTLRDEYRSGKESLAEMADVMHEAIEGIDQQLRGHQPGISTGYRDLDRFGFRLRPGELIILAARPSMGKSALAVNTATRVGKDVLFVSLEMSAKEIGTRMLAAETSIDITQLSDKRDHSRERKRLVEAANNFAAQSGITFDHTPGRTVWDIAAVARRMKRKGKLQLIIIDYLQLLTAIDRKIPRHEQVSNQTRALKLLARELEVPIICLAQLNRQTEQGTDYTPKLSHLRESGAIEQDADVVLFVHRPGHYDPKLPQDEAELRIAKQRNGQTGVVKVAWHKQFTRFDDLEEATILQNHNPEFDNGNWSTSS
jgi:replicative DNA helicase